MLYFWEGDQHRRVQAASISRNDDGVSIKLTLRIEYVDLQPCRGYRNRNVICGVVEIILNENVDEDMAVRAESAPGKAEKINGPKLIWNDATVERIQDDGIITAILIPQKRRAVGNVTFDCRRKRKNRRAMRKATGSISTTVTFKPAHANIVPSVPPPQPIMRTSRAPVCRTMPKTA
jgi:hypothetical protein